MPTRRFEFVKDGESANANQLHQMRYLKVYLWGDVFYHLYEREDGKIFAQSEWMGNTTGFEGYWRSVSH